MEDLLQRKKLALFAHDLRTLPELTSRVAYFYPDAYRSQGAFLHVLIEVQAGVRPPRMQPADYLDSAYDNLGLLLSSAAATTDYGLRTTRPGSACGACVCSAPFSKYTARMAHALRRAAQVQADAAFAHECEGLVHYFDAVSSRDASRASLPCSMGIMSRQLTADNEAGARHATFYGGVFAQRSAYRRRKCAYYVPHRSLNDDVDVMTFSRTVMRTLDALARRFSV